MTGSISTARRGLLALSVFVVVFSVHFAWLTLFETQARWMSLDGTATSPVRLYLESQGYWLGFSDGLALAFAAHALRRYREERSCAAGTLAIGGVTLSGFLGVAGCYLLGCCGSPMLAIYLTVFGAAFLLLAKPLVAALTVVSVVGASCWMNRSRRCAAIPAPEDVERGPR